MDNFGATSTSENDDTFAYVPPNLMYDGFKNSNGMSKEEIERKKYHYEQKLEAEDRKIHLKNSDK
ncbi:MAG: hypothetical protein ACI4EV_07415 [Lachnospiraceae bacterium]